MSKSVFGQDAARQTLRRKTSFSPSALPSPFTTFVPVDAGRDGKENIGHPQGLSGGGSGLGGDHDVRDRRDDHERGFADPFRPFRGFSVPDYLGGQCLSVGDHRFLAFVRFAGGYSWVSAGVPLRCGGLWGGFAGVRFGRFVVDFGRGPGGAGHRRGGGDERQYGFDPAYLPA